MMYQEKAAYVNRVFLVMCHQLGNKKHLLKEVLLMTKYHHFHSKVGQMLKMHWQKLVLIQRKPPE